jgi:hypothetical protein
MCAVHTLWADPHKQNHGSEYQTFLLALPFDE